MNRVGEVWEGVNNSCWDGLHIVVRSEKRTRSSYWMTHTLLSLDNGKLHTAQEKIGDRWLNLHHWHKVT